jgi:Domain of unknown function (DUF5655)
MSDEGSGKWPVARTDADFEPLLAGQPEQTTGMFWRFIELARAAGPVDFELQRDRVILRGRRIFASVKPDKRGLAGHLNLPRRVSDRRFSKTEDFTKRLVFHRYRLTDPADLDADFAGWLAEALDPPPPA